MPENQNPDDLHIPAGAALIFDAPEGGWGWKMHNTPQGLVIEAHTAVPLGAPARTVILRGNLTVAGEVERLAGPNHFLREWKVVTSSGTGSQGRVEIVSMGNGQLKIREKDRQPPTEQILVFNRWTGTLDSAEGQPGPYRCISFWDHQISGGESDRIFAMRTERGEDDIPFSFEEDDPGQNHGSGTWGAEPGG